MEPDTVPKSVTEETIVSLAASPDTPPRESSAAEEVFSPSDAAPPPIRHRSNGTGDSLEGGEQETEHSVTNSMNNAAAAPRRKPLASQVSVRSELDEVDYDRLSELSLHMVKDFRYYFQVPYLRLVVAYLVVFCNFLIYAEDPVAHSVSECSIPVIGNAFAFVATRYPPNAWSLLKVVLWLSSLLTGIVLGKLIHVFLLNRLLRLKAFSGDQGSWMTMFFTTILCLFIFSWIYNLFLLAGGDSTVPYRISSLMGISNGSFMKAAACGTWLGDLFTAWMVTDVMLQEKLYPNWAKTVREWWVKSYHRIILFWIVVVTCTAIVVTVISTDFIQWDSLNHGFLPSNELSRAFLASFILVMDLLIVIQDWDFPHFLTNFDVKLPGVNSVSVQFDVPSWLKEDWQVHITGKWFNYGILLMVMLLDLNMWKNQIFYSPFAFGQYVGPGNKIYTVINRTQLDMFNKTYLTYAWRSNNTYDANGTMYYINEDTPMNSMYHHYSLGVKAVAFLPSIAAFIVFGMLIAVYGRFPVTESKRYFGRMKKRRLTARKRMSDRRFSRTKRTVSSTSTKMQDCPTIAEEGESRTARQGSAARDLDERRKRRQLMRAGAIDEEAAAESNGKDAGEESKSFKIESEGKRKERTRRKGSNLNAQNSKEVSSNVNETIIH